MNYYRRFIYSLLILCCISARSGLYAQYQPGTLANGLIPVVTPPSSEAASLSKYGEYQVSLYTGLPNISIPIYTIQSGSLATTVSLSYHGAGVKIDDVESSVGVNWSLNAGGAITRTIVGLPDEEAPGGFLYRNQHNLALKTSYQLDNLDDYVFMRKVRDRLIDSEPDIFYFNFAGFSGKFFFDETGVFHSIPANALKLLKCPVNNTLTTPADKYWEIADPNGNIYQFGANDLQGIEKSIVYKDAPSTSDMKITAWYLTKITSADHTDVITFSYVTKTERYDLPYQHSYRDIVQSFTQSEMPGDLRENTMLYNGMRPQNAVPNTLMATGESLLKEITWSDGSLVFDANISRSTMVGKMLTNITLFNSADIKKKAFEFKYGYVNQRYFLDTLIESGSDLTKLLKHSFQYEQRQNLPARLISNAQDHWGYYNGANSNTSLLPNQTSIPTTLNNDRECHEPYMRYGSLNRIDYPTGGYTTFAFEANQFDPSQFPPGGTTPVVISTSRTVKAANPQPSSPPTVRSFNIPFLQNNGSISIKFRNYNKPPEAHVGWLPLIRLEKLVNGVYQTVYYWDAYQNFPVGNVPPPNINGFIDFDLTLPLSNLLGDYRLTAALVCGSPNCGTPTVYPSAEATMYYSDVYTPPAEQPSTIAGGLRISSISSFTYGINLSTKKIFNYTPGRVLFYPKYINQYIEDAYQYSSCMGSSTCLNWDICQPIEARIKEINSTSQTILGFTQGSAVGYTDVEEIDVDAGGVPNGKTTYAYSFTDDVLNEMQVAPFWSGNDIDILNASMPADNFEYKRGLLLHKKVYSLGSMTATPFLLHSVVNNYTFNDNVSANRYKKLHAVRIKTMRVVNEYRCGQLYQGYKLPTTNTGLMAPDYAYTFYNLVTSWVQQQTSVETTYSPYGGTPLVKTTNYTYGNAVHLQPTAISTTNSAGETIKTVNKYPHDFAGTAVYDAMITRNQVSPVIEQITYRNETEEVARKKLNYDFWNGTNIIAPKTEYTTLMQQTPFLTMTYDSYDNSGNLTQYTGRDGITTSLVYGYNYGKLVAQVTGANQAAVAGKINIANIQTMTGSSLRSALNNLRTIGGAQTISYTYEPLIGISSLSDMNNITTYYEYDVLGRLKVIKDNQLNVRKTIDYQYKIALNQ